VWFWEDWDLMCWLLDERPEVYHRYIRRVMCRAKQRRMSKYDWARFVQFLKRMRDQSDEDLRTMHRIIRQTDLGLRVVSGRRR
jgi:hypothetical protein